MELVIASNNVNKIREIREIIGGAFEKTYSLAELNIHCDPEETAEDFLGNALIKARAIREYTDKAVIADDSGLMVDCLGGAPGVHSARYAGEPVSDEANNALLLKNMEGRSPRTAKYVATMVLLYPDGSYKVGTGEVKGEIITEARGKGGFGYDPYFYSYDLQKTFGEATPNEKNAVSHRAMALHDLLKQL
ncbi:MAG: RdgB/HAM1 family non-canonical purine NTP pyrophosphatase [Clostridia bacterium]|nr:RdgB/HAM1 family non-canonical purine NTP pyrophosphatase [Clostridia bacterium]